MLSTLLPLFDEVVFTRSSRRGALAGRDARRAWRVSSAVRSRRSSRRRATALARARELAGPEGAVVVTGSIYLLSDLARVTAAPAKELS